MWCSMRAYFLILFLCGASNLLAQTTWEDKFRQLDELLPTANTYRTASGAPGHQYWQQRADYRIRVTLDEQLHRITGSGQITYYNNAPDTLPYLWLQLDQNLARADSDHQTTKTVTNKSDWSKPSASEDSVQFNFLRSLNARTQFEAGFVIKSISSGGKALPFTINKTMMRVDLNAPLKPGEQIRIDLEWAYNINEMKIIGGRAGYEVFPEDKNAIYEMAQWYPRMAAYYDQQGWQNKQYLGTGEFALEFGDFDVQMTVPADHIVAATGELQNASSVLTPEQQRRLKTARSSDEPVLIVSQAEAQAKEALRSKETQTWHFKAKNVRDFAWASSRKFIWDAQGYKKGATDMMAMSFYPKEANPLWGKYSTRAVVHTIDQYNRYTLDYPYPVAISVNGPQGGMEYPMISFNGQRPVLDKKTGELSYSKFTKYRLIGIIIHEVGHNYFPMIINSDERQWGWMDEGLNSFLQTLAQRAWEPDYPQQRADPRLIVNTQRAKNMSPVMTGSDSLLNLSFSYYQRPAIALNVLRETILGRELFDFALREYARRWAFKRPTPADFFRTMEDASGIDLDWFWRGWFYSQDEVNVSIDKITEYSVSSKNPEVEKEFKRALKNQGPRWISEIRDKHTPTLLDKHPELSDFYNEHDDYTVTNKERNQYRELIANLEDWEKDLLNEKKHFYLVDISNLGGLVTPLILEIELRSGKKIIERSPAEIWRYSPKRITKLIVTDEPMVGLVQDPYLETVDIDMSDNAWPRKIEHQRLELFKQNRERDNLMQDIKTPLRQEKPAKSE